MALADLNTLHYSKLQKFCRLGPDAPFDALGLTRSQWSDCLATGPGCKAVMIANITKLCRQQAQPAAAQPDVAECPASGRRAILGWCQQYYDQNWPSRKDAPPAAPAVPIGTTLMRHSVWLDKSADFYRGWFRKLSNAKTEADQKHRAATIGGKVARLLLEKQNVRVALMDGVGRIVYEALRVAREKLAEMIACEKLKLDADELLDEYLTVEVYDIVKKMNDCHRRLLPNVVVVEKNIIPAGGGIEHLEGVQIVYFNFSTLIMNKVHMNDLVPKAYNRNKDQELSAAAQTKNLQSCVQKLLSKTKTTVMVSVSTSHGADSLSTIFKPADYELEYVAPDAARRNFQTAWIAPK